MPRRTLFAFRVNQDERNLIASLADKLQRSQSDAVRFVVVNAIRELESHEQANSQKTMKAVRHEN